MSFVSPRAGVDPNALAIAWLDDYQSAGDLRLAEIHRATDGPTLLGYATTWRTPEHGWLPTDPAIFRFPALHPTLNDATRFVTEQAPLYCQLFLPA